MRKTSGIGLVQNGVIIAGRSRASRGSVSAGRMLATMATFTLLAVFVANRAMAQQVTWSTAKILARCVTTVRKRGRTISVTRDQLKTNSGRNL
jgi:hypothetical protein